LKFVFRRHIDPYRWNACIERSAYSVPYARFEYLDSLSRNSWAAVIEGDYQAVFPIIFKRKFGLFPYVYQPAFCQQLGIFGTPEHTIDAFVSRIPFYFVRIHLNVNGFFGAPSSSVTLPNLVKKAPHLWDIDLNKDAQKNIKRLQHLHVYYTQTRDIGMVIKLYSQAWGKKAQLHWPKDYLPFESACLSLQTLDLVYACVAQKDHEILGAAIFLKGNKKLHYVCAAPTESGRNVGIMHGIIHHVMEHFPDWDIDFEGSQIPSVAAFYKKFNPIDEPYYRIERTLWL
jgi:hypothetical protein